MFHHKWTCGDPQYLFHGEADFLISFKVQQSLELQSCLEFTKWEGYHSHSAMLIIYLTFIYIKELLAKINYYFILILNSLFYKPICLTATYVPLCTLYIDIWTCEPLCHGKVEVLTPFAKRFSKCLIKLLLGQYCCF